MIALAVLFDVVLIAVGGLALLRGGTPERLGAIVFLVGCVGSSAARLTQWASWDAGGPTLLIDLAATIALYWLACRTVRFWPIWGFGFLLANLAVDVSKIALPLVHLRVFASGQTILTYLALAALAVGTVGEQRLVAGASGFRPRWKQPPSSKTPID